MNTAIVITTIYQPTEAVEKFSELQNYQLIVVGDKKTPGGWACNNTTFLAVDSGASARFSLNSVLPYNHYCRKMLGYLFAIQNGAEAIIDTDDDNIPNNGWGFPGFEGDFECVENTGFVNIYKLFTSQHIWPRGLPLNMINNQDEIVLKEKKAAKIGIWQGLADEDPDVDAIYRLTSNLPCYFNKRQPVVLNIDAVVPFNSQNTMIRKELFALLYLPTYVTFRFTDILRGLVAQPIMWLYGYQLGFTDATVIQKRNPHNFHDDFISEIPMYQHCESVLEIVKSVISIRKTISENLYSAYSALKANNIVQDRELVTLKAWLKDLAEIVEK